MSGCSTEEDAIAGTELAAARALADEKAPGGYDAPRDAVTMAVVNRVFDDEAARRVLADVDQRAAAPVSRGRSTGPAE